DPRGQVQYVQADIPAYWAYATQFGLGDNFFSGVTSASQPNHIELIAGQTGDQYANQGTCGTSPLVLMYSRSTSALSYFGLPCTGINSLPQEPTQWGQFRLRAGSIQPPAQRRRNCRGDRLRRGYRQQSHPGLRADHPGESVPAAAETGVSSPRGSRSAPAG